MSKLFDLRFVIGAFFLVVGVMLLIYALVASYEAAQKVNLWCGAVFTAFGLFMVVLSFGKDVDEDLD